MGLFDNNEEKKKRLAHQKKLANEKRLKKESKQRKKLAEKRRQKLRQEQDKVDLELAKVMGGGPGAKKTSKPVSLNRGSMSGNISQPFGNNSNQAASSPAMPRLKRF